MIIDSFEHILMYEPIVKGLKTSMEEISNISDLIEGRYKLEKGHYIVQSGETHAMEEGTFEAHRKYIDVQIIIDGAEEIAWSDIKDLTVEMPYDNEKDVERFNGKKTQCMLISKGMFYIVFPHDGHKAISHTREKQFYKKIVIKIPIDMESRSYRT